MIKLVLHNRSISVSIEMLVWISCYFMWLMISTFHLRMNAFGRKPSSQVKQKKLQTSLSLFYCWTVKELTTPLIRLALEINTTGHALNKGDETKGQRAAHSVSAVRPVHWMWQGFCEHVITDCIRMHLHKEVELRLYRQKQYSGQLSISQPLP